MKKFLILSLAASLTCSISFAKIWRVNNNPGVSANFTSAQQAHDDANVLPGDTLYFEPSVTTYGNIIMEKSLSLIGSGYFLPQNPGLQYISETSALLDIILRPTANNSVISVNCRNLTDSADNVTITRCRIEYLIFTMADNCIVSNCFISTSINFIQAILFSPCRFYTCQNVAVYNNIILGGIEMGLRFYALCGTYYETPHSVTAFNNSISGGMNITGFAYNNITQFIHTDNSTIATNNIFTGAQNLSYRTNSLPGGSYNNIELESGNSNQFSVPVSSLFTSISIPVDTAWRLLPACVAFGAGTSGMDCGATGGSNPYVFGLQPAIPAIYKLNVAPQPSGNSIGVTISTRSNN